MLILGLDPGTATTGYGFIKVKSPKEIEVGEYGLIETDQSDGNHGKRFTTIRKRLSGLIRKYSPDLIAMEMLFFATNAKTAIRVGQAQGVLLLTAAEGKIPVSEYAPGRIKKLVSGNGRAKKDEMQTAVRKFLGRGIRKKKGGKTHFDNAADALAVALCHILENKLYNKKDEN